MEDKKCVICGFEKKVEKHHLKKYLDFGSDCEENLVFLCPNHHWIADFGEEKDKELILRSIKRLTGKEPITNNAKKEYIDKLIRADIEYQFGKFSDEEYAKQFNCSWNYDLSKSILLSRPSNANYRLKEKYLERCELLYIKNLINKRLDEILNHAKN